MAAERESHRPKRRLQLRRSMQLLSHLQWQGRLGPGSAQRNWLRPRGLGNGEALLFDKMEKGIRICVTHYQMATLRRDRALR